MTLTITDAKADARRATIDLLVELAHESEHGSVILALARHASECQRLKSEPLLYWADLRRRVAKFRTLALCGSPEVPYLFDGLAGTLRADVRWEVDRG